MATADTGMLVKNGVNVVLAGKPNAGKSSLLNQLLGYERAIVTDIAGTTRDTVSESFEYRGVRFNLIDTAGLRDTMDIVESAGIERAKKEIDHADIVVALFDPIDDNAEQIEGKNIIKVLNKIDLKIATKIKADIAISARTGENVDALKEMIFDRTINSEVLLNGDFLTNTRHIERLKEAREALVDTVQNCSTATLDCLAVTLMQAWNKLGEITGETANEKILNEIFARFCLGK